MSTHSQETAPDTAYLAETSEPRFGVRLSHLYEVYDRRDGQIVGSNYQTVQEAAKFATHLNHVVAAVKGRWT